MKVRRGTDERNLARLTPVLALNRVPAGMVGWRKSVQVDELGAIEVSCLAGRNQVVPHGIDADVMFALTTLYVLQGKPAYGTVTVSVAELCEAAGFVRGAVTYARLRESLERLLHVSYKVVDCWASPTRQGRWNFASLEFGIVSALAQVDVDAADDVPLGQYRATTQLKISLSPQLVGSLGAGHVRPVDLDFYARLEQPMSRLLYRTLEEQRHLPGADPTRFSVPLLAWADHLGLRTLAAHERVRAADVAGTGRIPETEVLPPDRVRRALDPAHEELLSRGYLKAAEYVGRGGAARVDYVFGAVSQPVDLELVALLTCRGVSAPVAERHVRAHTEAEVREAVLRFDARIAAGYAPRNRAGLLLDMLEHPQKYPPTPKPLTEQVLVSSRPASASEPEPPSLPVRDEKAARLALGRRFEGSAFAALRERAIRLYLAGEVSALDLASLSALEVTQAERVLWGWEEEAQAPFPAPAGP